MVDPSSTPGLIARLQTLAYNLWWVWNPRAQQIFEDLSPLAWEETNHNPVAVLSQVSNSELTANLNDPELRSMLIDVLGDFDRYMGAAPRTEVATGSATGSSTGEGPAWRKRVSADPVAYFCAEFGLHESLRFYSGGLGVLAGDHVKSASDLGIPLVGIGLFYRKGYFRQRIDQGGNQIEEYPDLEPSIIPATPVVAANGMPLKASVSIGGQEIWFRGWEVKVGRNSVYLLDTDVPDNTAAIQGLTSLAYGGDTGMRIRQEIVLGIGGVRFLKALGIRPSVFHINEGHAAFLTLELLREELGTTASVLGVQQRAAAEENVRRRCVFTTHTPVPAGHDRFPRQLIEQTLGDLTASMQLSMDDLMRYGTPPAPAADNEFTMTILALKLTRAANGVSKRHGEISQLMWKDIPRPAAGEIGYVTNGVHVPSWTSRRSWEFWERHDSHRWKDRIHDAEFWNTVTDPGVVSDGELWALRYTLRRDLIEFIRRKALQGKVTGGPKGREAIYNLLSYDALTIGFARRFAAYKRAPLLFSDMEKAGKLFSDAKRPVQIIYAGKAHPRDEPGKAFIRQVTDLCNSREFHGKIVFIENYDMNVARYLVSGCDIWLNTPRAPLEASGTSGQKVAVNGGLQASILDGWWIEGYDGSNGWGITPDAAPDHQHQEVDKREAAAIYSAFLDEIVPLFYDRDAEGLPRGWIDRIRKSMRTIVPQFNTHRMVGEYAERYYFPERA